MRTRSPKSSKYRECYAVGTRCLASIAIGCTIKNLLDNGIRYAAVKALICRRLIPLLGRLPICWGCLGLVMWDSSSRVERLRTPRDRESESAVVPAFVLPVILALLRPRCEASGVHVGQAWAYRDVLNDAQVALSVVRRACELRTFLIKVP
ncbi:hypothetical protein CDL15_Pgr017427 [Punica granatum]|uniref:Uncharacterized protein n=1 Tax=Punica granatum TaxID=22663 RepID=A0A218WQQ5_PUNGR|nr:hypothetical protein CDL15_Pgr017427 [Punica granatum]